MKTAADVMRETGGYISAIPLLKIGGVGSAFGEILARVQALPFVPSSWTEQVKAAMSEGVPGAMWQPRHATALGAWRSGKLSPLYDDVPGWLSDEDQIEAWNNLADWWQTRMQPILAGWARDEASVMNAAANDAKFWNTLYTVVKPIAAVGDMIIAAPEVIGEVASKSVMGALRGFAPILIIVALVGAGFLVYKSGAYKKLINPPA